MTRIPLVLCAVFVSAFSMTACGPKKKHKTPAAPPVEANANAQEETSADVEALQRENARLREAEHQLTLEKARFAADLAEAHARVEAEALRVQELTTSLAAKDAELKELVARRDAMQRALTESESAHAATVKELEAVRDRIAELEAQVRGLEGELARAKSDLTARQAELDAARSELNGVTAELAAIKESQGPMARLVGVLMAPLAGLWQGDVRRGMPGQNACRMFYAIDGVFYVKALVCRDGSDPLRKAAYERGAFVDLFRAMEPRAGAPRAEVDVLTVTAPLAASCDPEGFHGRTTNLAWAQDFATFLNVDFDPDQDSGLTIARGDATRATASCAEILARAARPGLEDAVLACTLFAASAEDMGRRADVGCFEEASGALRWTKNPVTPIE